MSLFLEGSVWFKPLFCLTSGIRGETNTGGSHD